MKKLFIIGAGGFGREVAWLVERINNQSTIWDLRGFLDDDKSIHGTIGNGYKILGSCDYLGKIQEEVWCVCAVGSAEIRKKIVENISNYQNVKFATLIDPDVTCSESVVIEEGSIICAGTILTVNISIGKHAILNLDCTVGHDVVLKEYVTVYPSVNISGNVIVGDGVELGTGTQVIQGTQIIRNTIVGAGSVVIRDIVEQGTYVGSPVKKIR